MSVLGTLHSALRLKKYEMIGRCRKIAELPVDVPVDFVVPWVDDTDERWRQEKGKYANTEIKGNGVERYATGDSSYTGSVRWKNMRRGSERSISSHTVMCQNG